MTGTFLLRRTSTGPAGRMESVPVRANFDDIKQHLKHLGPSNRASNPKTTRSTTVKIKPGIVVHEQPRGVSVAEAIIPEVPNDDEDGGETTSLLKGGKDGVQVLAQSYGAIGTGTRSRPATPGEQTDIPKQEDEATQTSAHASTADLTAAASPEAQLRPQKSSSGSETERLEAGSPYRHRTGLFARSGSITEQVVETRGIKKTVLETTSSNEEEEDTRHRRMTSRSNLSLSSGAPLSPVAGDEDEPASTSTSTPGLTAGSTEGAGSGEGAEAGSSAAGDASNQHAGGNGGSKKKTRRKKRKGKS